jgi:hypothetical protein
MSDKPSVTVKAALIRQFNEAHRIFMDASNSSARDMVRSVNYTRTMGFLIKELLGRENVTENCLREWLRDNSGALAETEVAWLMNYVRISNKMQNQPKQLNDIPNSVMQMTFQCSGIIEIPGARELAQTSHELTPSVQSWKFYTDFKIRFEGMIKAAPTWNEEQREAVRENIEKTRAFLTELETRL